MRIRTQCKACGFPFSAKLTRHTRELSCSNCDDTRPVSTDDWQDEEPRSIEVCVLCSCRHLYRQRDFNRAVGCLVVLIGAILVPWTYGLSLVAFSLFDFWLYRRLPDTVVCYRCDTVYRDARPGARQKDFDLLKHDVLKYGKSWGSVEEL